MKHAEQTIVGMSSYLTLISNVHMSTSAKPTPVSSVTKSEVTAILEDYYFYCPAAGLDVSPLHSWKKRDCQAVHVPSRQRGSSRAKNLC